MANQPSEKKIPGTSISEDRMKRMLAHNRQVVGPVHEAAPPVVDHAAIAAGLSASQPILDPSLGAPRVRSSRVVERVLRAQEGVQGTSPTPGQDNIDYIPPTTSDTADPGNPGKGPDAETEPASARSKKERLMADLESLIVLEGDNPFAKDKDDKDDKDGKSKDKDDDGDEKDDDGDEDDEEKGENEEDDEPVEEAVEVHCNECGYEEVYSLSEANISEGKVPLTTEGKLDTKCPMCGTDMDLSMMGATNTGEVTDPNPRTDARGNSGSRISQECLELAHSLSDRVARGESVEMVAASVIKGDFIPRKRQAA